MCCFPWCCCKRKPKGSIPTNSILIEPSDISDNISPLSNKRRSMLDKKKSRNFLPPKLPSKNINLKRMYELKDKFRCLFCGWESCKHEDWRRNKNTVIEGLNCDRITEDLFASQRPSTVLIQKYNLIKIFKDLNIGLIVNVQRQGEHPYCGPNKGLEEISGFTYNPESFMTEGIRVRLSGWKDMNVPDSIPFMLEIVKDMLMTVKGEGRKVLVHCHAGYGRTGIVLACFMIFISTKSAEMIVKEIRKVRKECVQKKAQMDYCKTFKNYIDRAREIFTSTKKDVDYFIKNQVDLSFGDDVEKFQHVPKILFIVFEKIIALKEQNQIMKMVIYQSLNGSSEWIDESEVILVELKIILNKGSWECLDEIRNLNVLIELCYDWLEDCTIYVINPTRIDKLFNDDPLLSTKLKQIIAEPRGSSKEDRRTLTNFIKNELRMVEFETLTCIAHFAGEIYPDDDLKQKEEFNLMLEKLSIYILGFTIDNLYENPIPSKVDKLKALVDNMIDLIIFCIIVMKYDLIEENTNSFYKLQTKNSNFASDNMSQFIVRKMEENYTNNSIFGSNDFTKFLSKYLTIMKDKEKRSSKSSKNSINKYLNSGDISPKGTSLFNKGVNKESEKEKDLFLYNMYNLLHKYFENKVINEGEENGFNILKNHLNPFEDDQRSMNKIQNSSREIDNVERLNDFYEYMFKILTTNSTNFGTNCDTFNSSNIQRNSMNKTNIKNVYININGNNLERDKNNEIDSNDINNGTELEELKDNKTFYQLFKEKSENKHKQSGNDKFTAHFENMENFNSKFSFNLNNDGDAAIKLKRIEDSDIVNDYQLHLNKEHFYSLSQYARNFEDERENQAHSNVNANNNLSMKNVDKKISSKELPISLFQNHSENVKKNIIEINQKLNLHKNIKTEIIMPLTIEKIHSANIGLMKVNSATINRNIDQDKNKYSYIRPKSRLRTIRGNGVPQSNSRQMNIQQASSNIYFSEPVKEGKIESKDNINFSNSEDKEIREKVETKLIILDDK